MVKNLSLLGFPRIPQDLIAGEFAFKVSTNKNEVTLTQFELVKWNFGQ